MNEISDDSYEDFDELEPVPFKPVRKLRYYDDLEGSGFDDFGPYGTYYDESFEDLVRENFRSLVNPLDELEDQDAQGKTLEYRGRASKP